MRNKPKFGVIFCKMIKSIDDMAKAPQIENSAKITLESFAELAKQMRHAQRRYRRFGKLEILEQMERLEAEFDLQIEEILYPQPKLF